MDRVLLEGNVCSLSGQDGDAAVVHSESEEVGAYTVLAPEFDNEEPLSKLVWSR